MIVNPLSALEPSMSLVVCEELIMLSIDDRRLIFIKPLLDKAMIKLGPIFEPMKQATMNLYSRYTDEELTIILDFITNCNRMTQKLTAEMKTHST